MKVVANGISLEIEDSDTAHRIAGARLVGVPGMGHDLAPGVVEQIPTPLMPHLESRRTAA